MNLIKSKCPICEVEHNFKSADDFWSCRDGLISNDCGLGMCNVRDRAIANALFSLVDRKSIKHLSIHEPASSSRGISLYLENNIPNYVKSGFFPDHVWGEIVGKLRNEDLESQTFDDASFDFVILLDVMEHLFNPFLALNEIYRTLKPNGICLFTAPTYHDLFNSKQVALLSESKELKIIGEPEYHGNPQRESEGSLVTWRYGYDLPLLISRLTNFSIEVRRYQSKSIAVMGYMTEVYILKK
jgi:SAM-dependent methyltransferase